jgi:hypothetical protein
MGFGFIGKSSALSELARRARLNSLSYRGAADFCLAAPPIFEHRRRSGRHFDAVGLHRCADPAEIWLALRISGSNVFEEGDH